MIHDRGIWLEVVTLLGAGFNDDPEELAVHRRSFLFR